MSDKDVIHKMEKIKLSPDEYLVVYMKEDTNMAQMETMWASLQRIFTKHKGRVLIVRGESIKMEKRYLDDLLAEIAEKSLL